MKSVRAARASQATLPWKEHRLTDGPDSTELNFAKYIVCEGNTESAEGICSRAIVPPSEPKSPDSGQPPASFALPGDISELIEKGTAGDPFAMGRLYGIAGALISAGNSLPEPLRGVIAARLSALGASFTTRKLGDVRQRALEALVPVNGKMRPVGAKRKSVAHLAAEAAIDLLSVDSSDRRRAQVVAAVATITNAPVKSINDQIDRIRTARNSRERLD
jgi:hypothetical protein